MLKVGITGGIASGKSTVEAAFARLGVPVADADAETRALSEPGQPGLTALVGLLGPSILDESGHLDRKALRGRLFGDAGLRRRVEKELHPLVLERLRTRLQGFKAAYSLAVIPLLVEVPAARALVDRVLLVDCPEELQLARLMSRDGETESQARAILAAQAPRAARRAAADDILLNEGVTAALEKSVARLHGYYLELAAQGDFHRAGLRLP